jgi:hypothetical protein
VAQIEQLVLEGDLRLWIRHGVADLASEDDEDRHNRRR